MNKQLTICFITAVALNTLAQYQGPYWTSFGSGRQGFNQYGGSQWSNQLTENWYSGNWEFGEGDENNQTTAPGSAAFYRSRNSNPIHLFINHDITGYLGATVNRSGTLSGKQTFIDVDPGVTIRSSTGYAVVMGDNNSQNNAVGAWTITGGDYYGTSGHEALYARKVNSLTIDSASFYAGNGGGTKAGLWIGSGSGNLTITNTRDRDDIVYQATEETDTGAPAPGLMSYTTTSISGGGSFTSQKTQTGERTSRNVVDNLDGRNAGATGASGAVIDGTATFSGTKRFFFLGSRAGSATAGGKSATASAYGGNGVVASTLNAYFTNSTFRAGNGGSAEIVEAEYLIDEDTFEVSAVNGSARAHGGNGIYAGSGTITMDDSEAYGGNTSLAIANDTNGYADATGGNGIIIGDTVTINGGYYQGGHAGYASAALGDAYAFGGSGVLGLGSPSATVTINGGTFVGGNGGTVVAGSDGAANGGAGAAVIDGTLNINGGTFRGGAAGELNGTASWGNAGIWADNADLNITENEGKTLVDGDIVFVNSSTKALNIQSGTIKGGIVKSGTGTATVNVGTGAHYDGTFAQYQGNVNVNLTSSDQSDFFSDVAVYGGTFDFQGSAPVVTPENARFTTGSSSATLDFSNGAELGDGSSINVGYGKVTSTGGKLILRDGTSASIAYDSRSGTKGSLDVTGTLVITNDATFYLLGTSSTPTGRVQVATATTVDSTGRNLDDIAEVNLGWLNKEEATVINNGIRVDYGYNSLTNSSLGDGTIDYDLLTRVDGVLTDTNFTSEAAFYKLNRSSGPEAFRYPLAQIPDVSETSFEVSKQVNQQIAARGTEFRSMNGFASTKPKFTSPQPTGVAGPKTDDERTMQGWIRAYGAYGNRDADSSGSFAAYDSSTWGSVIGVDKSFGNILLGVAGGIARSDLDAGSSYEADVTTYHGSVYSSIGGETVFVDLAATYAQASTTEKNIQMQDAEFDSDIISGYIGLGKRFDFEEKFSLTPEASLLATYYGQDAYDRIGGDLALSGTVEDYDTTSYVGSLGLNLSTIHQIDWLNQGIALIPEVRGHWLHDFDADPDNVNITFFGNSYSSAVRPREEDMFRLGAGFDIWSWKYQNTKFEFDYDGLFSSDYTEHAVSGKVTYRF